MDSTSILLLCALNIPLLLSLCRWFQKTYYRDKENFWGSLLSWSFDPWAFFDKEYKHNHLAVLFVSLAVGCCALLIPLEYEAAHRVVDLVRFYGPIQLLANF